MLRFLLLSLGLFASSVIAQEPFRVAIAGLAHGHIIGFFNNRLNRTDWQLVGISEPQTEVLQKYAAAYDFPSSILFDDIDTMLDATQPEAVLLMGNIYDHLPHTVAAAKRGIHVMMEKPLGINTAHALQVQQACRDGDIICFINYETTFYDNTHYVKNVFDTSNPDLPYGPPVHMIARGGHAGIDNNPSVPPEFFEWLVDPALGGGGVTFDYACYGANMFTFLKNDEVPTSVQATINNFKTNPDYGGIDDDAMITVNYRSGSVGVIEASWNWPYHMKEIDVYGLSGSVKAHTGGLDVSIRTGGSTDDRVRVPQTSFVDEITFFIEVVRDGREISGDATLQNNVIVVQILEAALLSGKCGGCVITL